MYREKILRLYNLIFYYPYLVLLKLSWSRVVSSVSLTPSEAAGLACPAESDVELLINLTQT